MTVGEDDSLDGSNGVSTTRWKNDRNGKIVPRRVHDVTPESTGAELSFSSWGPRDNKNEWHGKSSASKGAENRSEFGARLPPNRFSGRDYNFFYTFFFRSGTDQRCLSRFLPCIIITSLILREKCRIENWKLQNSSLSYFHFWTVRTRNVAP